MSSTTFKRSVWLVAAASVSLILTGCAGGSGNAAPPNPTGGEPDNIVEGFYGGDELAIGEPVAGGELRLGQLLPTESLDPTGMVGGSSENTMQQIFDRLLKVNREGVIEPELAESFTSEDNVTWTMTLPQGVNFTDGTPFNAEAVVTHVENVAAEGSVSLTAGAARAIESMDTPDEHTVVFTLKEPDIQFGLNFAFGSLAMIPSPTAYAEAGKTFGLKPVGAGPFIVESFTPGGDIEYRKNPDYRVEGLPYVDTLTVVTVAEEISRMAALQSGDLDGATFTSAASLDEARNAGLTVLDQPWYSYMQVTLNLNKAPFDDARVRSALNLAVDREAINKVVYDGLSEPMDGVLSPNHPHAGDSGWPSEFNQERAKELLKEYTAETGESVDFHMYVAADEAQNKVAALLQQMYKDVGVAMEYEVATPTTTITAAMSGKFDAFIQDQGVPPETTNRLFNNYSSASFLNFGGAGTPDLDKLFTQAATSASNEERIAKIGPMKEALAGWVPTIPLVSGQLGRVVGADVGGFPDGIPYPSSQDFFEAKYVWLNQ